MNELDNSGICMGSGAVWPGWDFGSFTRGGWIDGGVDCIPAFFLSLSLLSYLPTYLGIKVAAHICID